MRENSHAFTMLISLILRFACLVLSDSFGKLVGARSVVSATNAKQQRCNFVDIFSFNETGDALQITAATADKTNVVHFIFAVNVE